MKHLTLLPLALALMIACGRGSTDALSGTRQLERTDRARFVDMTATQLPVSAVSGPSMDASSVDVDLDGDLDIIIANEFRSNILLINQGGDYFTNESARRLPESNHDSEDIGIADFDLDGDPDIVIVSEDDEDNELYLNDGKGYFTDASDRLPVAGISNAVVVFDVNMDGAPDIVIGNSGQNAALINDGRGWFIDETSLRLPKINDVTQDIEVGDIDGDGDLDLLIGNEDSNRLLLNDGSGVFSDQSKRRLPLRVTAEETREAELGDVDGDGDLDIVFANVKAFVPAADPQNRLLINDGRGFFRDETGHRLPQSNLRSFDVELLDIDNDGDLDLLTADAREGRNFEELVHLFLNDGGGRFLYVNGAILPTGIRGKWFDIEVADFNGDGRFDLYLSSQGSTDRLLIQYADHLFAGE